MSTQGYINKIETFGAVDGPGVRYIIFLQGCNMRCQYCHNPETWKLSENLDTEACSNLGVKKSDVQQVIDNALRYKQYWGDDGGITVSGGEPLLQIDFVTELFEVAKHQGIHTCIDTAGQPYSKDSEFQSKFCKLAKLTDLFIVDIKHFDSCKHAQLTGHPNENIMQMIADLDARENDMWVRHVLVPGITDDSENLLSIGRFLDKFPHVVKREILPYHNLGIAKWQQLGLRNKLADIDGPTQNQVEAAQQLIGCNK